ncbi:MAG: YbhB/YbcL family Raf kinase inhibitor-like protein, partial [Candidatus Omnitrophica bacterium]|nr:YbhB/YbcL family Raf kinase inhibitor-like protein [Candidatus Omnitrophota bacterium]
IEDIPSGAKSLALIVDDPDAPSRDWVHWLVFDMAPRNEIGEGDVPGKQGTNDFDKKDYGGPCPPSGEHRYYFRLYALDTKLELGEGVGRADMSQAMEGHILDRAKLMGKYSK